MTKEPESFEILRKKLVNIFTDAEVAFSVMIQTDSDEHSLIKEYLDKALKEMGR